MARIRSVKPELFHHEGLASCSPHARLLFIAMLQLADREGRFRWLPMQCHSHAFPHEPGIDVSSLAEELRAVGCIKAYRAGDKTFVDVANFTRHQRVPSSERPSTLPRPTEKTLTTFVRHDVAQPATRSKKKRASSKGADDEKNPGTQDSSAEKTLTGFVSIGGMEVWKDGKGKNGKEREGVGVQVVWDAYRKYHPRSRSTPTESWRRLIRGALRDYSAAEVCLVIRWAKESPDFSFQRKKGYDKLNNLLVASKMPGRMEKAEEWAGHGSSLDGWMEKNAQAALRYKDELEQFGRDMAPGSLIHYMAEYGLPVPSPEVEAKAIEWLKTRKV